LDPDRNFLPRVVSEDGTIEITLRDGQRLTLSPDQFTIGPDGTIAFSDDARALLAEALGAAPDLALIALVAPAGLIAAVAGGGGGDGNTAPAQIIGGVTTGDVTEDEGATLTATGALTITDTDDGEAVFVAQAGTAGSYGTFVLDTAGNWSYAADNAQAAIQALGDGVSLTDSFTAETADGTTQVVTITLTGVNDAAVTGRA
jgi:VCBS repeat-containing protein